MNQNQIDDQADGVTGFVAGGLIATLGAAVRWPSSAFIIVTVAAVLFLAAKGISSGYAQYATNAKAEAEALAAAQEKKGQAEFEMYLDGATLGFPLEGLYWRTVGALSDLEGLEIKGNQRAKAFRAEYKLSAGDQPDLSWIRLKEAIEADVAAADRGFTQTKAKIAAAEAKLAPAGRYVDAVKANQPHFAGEADLQLSKAFVAEFGGVRQ
ncbi:TPA: hypothetical protein NIA45_006753 [Pseudomonas aeruginosa]|nr:hypothetical protein [Pseudomonas aeruginosa]